MTRERPPPVRNRPSGVDFRVIALVVALLFGACSASGESADPRSTTMPSGRCDVDGPIQIAEQGSFYVPGERVMAAGGYDPGGPLLPLGDDGQSFEIGQMYVEYQIPTAVTGNAVVLVHGGGQTGAGFGSTPDGREGWDTQLLRRGHPVYVVDLPGRGRSAVPTFNGPFGQLSTPDGERVFVESPAARLGDKALFGLFRIGESPPDPYPDSQFPRQGVEQLLMQQVPWYLPLDDSQAIARSLTALLADVGPSVVVTHSQSGLLGWYLPEQSPDVAAVVALEPGAFIFESSAVPEPDRLSNGTVIPVSVPAGVPTVSALAEVPTLVVYGDHIPQEPDPVTSLDYWRVNREMAGRFRSALVALGGDIEVLDLPDLGITGNSHVMYADRNNAEVLSAVEKFVAGLGLSDC